MNLKLPPQATDSAFAKLKEVGSNSALRISVEGGGCSGFKYNIEFDNDISKDDYIISKENLRIVIDPVSLKFLDGSVIDYKSELVGSRFVIENPNAVSSCGCGTSFSI